MFLTKLFACFCYELAVLKLNCNKSLEMIVSRHKGPAYNDPPALPGITRTKSLNILGVTIDHHLSVADHVSSLVAGATKPSSQTVTAECALPYIRKVTSCFHVGLHSSLISAHDEIIFVCKATLTPSADHLQSSIYFSIVSN